MRNHRVTHASGALAGRQVPPIEPVAVPAVSPGVALAASMKTFKDMIRILTEWHQRIRQRRHLLELDDRLLKDIGLSRADAWREWRKPFWKP